MDDPSSNQPDRGSFHRVGLKKLLLVFVVAGIFLAITRGSPPVALLVVIATFGMLFTFYVRESSGLILLLFLIGLSLTVGLVMYLATIGIPG